MSDITEIAFDDIDGINALASEDFGEFGPAVEITQDMINTFADVTGDHQWIHVDIEKANAGPFGGPIAHGFLTLSMVASMRTGDSFKITGVSNAVNYGADKLRFMAPVAAGSSIQARTRLLGAEQKSMGTLVKTETAIHVVDAEKPSLIYQGLVLYM
ncbi:MAG: MaoC family dehydratase [Acidimicrobiales bacterium]